MIIQIIYAITSLGEESANLSAFRTFVRFVLVWICRFPLPLGVWQGMRFVIVALPGLFSYLFFQRYRLKSGLYRVNEKINQIFLKRPKPIMFDGFSSVSIGLFLTMIQII